MRPRKERRKAWLASRPRFTGDLQKQIEHEILVRSGALPTGLRLGVTREWRASWRGGNW